MDESLNLHGFLQHISWLFVCLKTRPFLSVWQDNFYVRCIKCLTVAFFDVFWHVIAFNSSLSPPRTGYFHARSVLGSGGRTFLQSEKKTCVLASSVEMRAGTHLHDCRCIITRIFRKVICTVWMLYHLYISIQYILQTYRILSSVRRLCLPLLPRVSNWKKTFIIVHTARALYGDSSSLTSAKLMAEWFK